MTRSLEEYNRRIKRIHRFANRLLIIFAIGITTPLSGIFFGLTLGTFIGLINFLITVNRINKIGEIAVNSSAGRSKPVFSGMLIRFALAILAIMIAYKNPQYFNLFSTIFGLLIVQIIAIVDGIFNK